MATYAPVVVRRAAVAPPAPPRPRPPRPTYATAPGYVLGEGAAPPVAAAVVAAPAVVYTDSVAGPGYRAPRPDPTWRLCQIDQRDGRTYLCGPHSYHPYGAPGYRPYGTYAGYRSAPVYLVAPDARVISIDTEN
jgi:hypothetical protein